MSEAFTCRARLLTIAEPGSPATDGRFVVDLEHRRRVEPPRAKCRPPLRAVATSSNGFTGAPAGGACDARRRPEAFSRKVCSPTAHRRRCPRGSAVHADARRDAQHDARRCHVEASALRLGTRRHRGRSTRVENPRHPSSICASGVRAHVVPGVLAPSTAAARHVSCPGGHRRTRPLPRAHQRAREAASRRASVDDGRARHESRARPASPPPALGAAHRAYTPRISCICAPYVLAAAAPRPRQLHARLGKVGRSTARCHAGERKPPQSPRREGGADAGGTLVGCRKVRSRPAMERRVHEGAAHPPSEPMAGLSRW